MGTTGLCANLCLIDLAGPPCPTNCKLPKSDPCKCRWRQSHELHAANLNARRAVCSIPGGPDSAEETVQPPAGQTIDMPFDSMSSGDEDGTSSFGVRAIGSTGNFDASLLRSAEELRDRRSRLGLRVLRNRLICSSGFFMSA